MAKWGLSYTKDIIQRLRIFVTGIDNYKDKLVARLQTEYFS